MTTATVDREQWLEARRKFIGGSDAASLFSEESKYGCERRLILDKRGTPPDYERGESEKLILERGTEMEEMIADRFSREFGFKVRRTPTFVNSSKPFIGVNMDRQIVSATTERIKHFWPDVDLRGECGPGYLECKTANRWDFKKLTTEGVIPDYVFQVQHGIGARGYRWGILAVLCPDSFEFRAFPFTAHDNLILVIQARAEDVWKQYVEQPERALPPIPKFTDGSERCRRCVYRRTCLGEAALLQMSGEKPATDYTADDSFAEVLTDYKEIAQQIDALEIVKGQIKEKIQEGMADKGYSKLEVPAIGMRVNWSEQKGAMRWDTRALEAEHPELAKDYKRPSAPTRPFKVTAL